MVLKETVPELNVGRINIVENDGTLRMVISSRDQPRYRRVAGHTQHA